MRKFSNTTQTEIFCLRPSAIMLCLSHNSTSDFSNFDVTFGKYVTCWVLALLQKQFCSSQHIRAKVLKRLISNRILDRFCDNSKAPLRRSRKINMEKISDDETLSRDAIKISAIASEYISSNLSFSVYIWNLSYYFAIQ